MKNKKSAFKYYSMICALLFFINVNAQQWEMVWSDEFSNSGAPDPAKWGYEEGRVRNNELQYYTKNRTENARIIDTTLVIEARKESYQGANYTSASLISQFKGDWLYGRIEVRAKLPTGKGTWPAIWMMPTYVEYGGWPMSGEIDIMENVGFDPKNIYTTTHLYGTDGTGHQGFGSVTAVNEPYNNFYTYAIEWYPDSINWFIDNKKVHQYKHTSVADYRLWPFDQKFYLILNLAIGGNWGGQQGVDSSLFPKKLYVDYVRVYQLATGSGPFGISVQPVKGGTIELNPKKDVYEKGSVVQVTAIPDDGFTFDRFVDMGSKNPFNIEIKNHTDIIPVFKKIQPEGELITNGSFVDGIANWDNLYIFDSKTEGAKASVIDGVYVFEIVKSTNVYWHLGFQQLKLNAVAGTTYHIFFDAWADNSAQLGVSFAKNYGDYSGYFEKSDFQVLKTKNRFTCDFTFNSPSDNNCRLLFSLGNFKSGKVYLDNISVKANTTSASVLNTNINTDQFQVFPNPTQERLNIRFKCETNSNVVIDVLNINGQLISNLFRNRLTTKNNELSFSLNRSLIPKGLYILRINSDNFIQSRLIILD